MVDLDREAGDHPLLAHPVHTALDRRDGQADLARHLGEGPPSVLAQHAQDVVVDAVDLGHARRSTPRRCPRKTPGAEPGRQARILRPGADSPQVACADHPDARAEAATVRGAGTGRPARYASGRDSGTMTRRPDREGMRHGRHTNASRRYGRCPRRIRRRAGPRTTRGRPRPRARAQSRARTTLARLGSAAPPGGRRPDPVRGGRGGGPGGAVAGRHTGASAYRGGLRPGDPRRTGHQGRGTALRPGRRRGLRRRGGPVRPRCRVRPARIVRRARRAARRPRRRAGWCALASALLGASTAPGSGNARADCHRATIEVTSGADKGRSVTELVRPTELRRFSVGQGWCSRTPPTRPRT